MKRAEYLADDQVDRFVEWSRHLVRGVWRLEHSWKGKGPEFRCPSLYEAYQSYRWPNSSSGQIFRQTVETFDECRQTFDKIGIIDTPDRQRKFVDTARSVARWGGINLPTLGRWERM